MFISEPLDQNATLRPDTSVQTSGVPSLLATNGLFIPLVTIVTGLRVYTRLFMTRRLVLDDYLMIAAAISFLVFASVNIAGTTIGFGLHGWQLPGTTFDEQLHAAELVLEHNFVSLVFLSPAICLSKLSIIATLLRIFTWQASRALRHILIVSALLVAVCCGAQLIFTIFQCTKVDLSWKLIDPAEKGSCGNLEAAILAAGIVNVIADFVICCTPIPVFMRLQLPLRQRLCISALFLSGLITSLFAILRVAYSRGLQNDPDATYVVVPYFNYSVAEAGLCIITGSIPALRPLLANVLPNFVETYNLETIVDSAKENIRRAASRQSSRQRRPSDAITLDLGRASTLGDEQDWKGTEQDDRQAAQHPAYHPLAWPPMFMNSKAKRSFDSLLERLRGTTPVDAPRGRQGRPLSVINELEEASDDDAQKRRRATLRGSVIELFRKPVGTPRASPSPAPPSVEALSAGVEEQREASIDTASCSDKEECAKEVEVPQQ